MNVRDDNFDDSATVPSKSGGKISCFTSPVISRVRSAGGLWKLSAGEIRLPRVFGFCRGVTAAIVSLMNALERHQDNGKKIILLGEIIHNPWVNEFFRERGVKILTRSECQEIEQHVGKDDCAIIPAFGVPLPIERRLGRVGCEIVDSSCGDVRRLWAWAKQAGQDGFGVLIFGTSGHDETVVTRSRLEDAGGKYVVAGDLDQIERFCEMITRGSPEANLSELFSCDSTNASDLSPFLHLAAVSQTTMLRDETILAQQMLTRAFTQRFGSGDLAQRLRLQPSVCKATQDRQTAAVELCDSDCDVAVVVGGRDSSNSRHLCELAGRYCRAYFIEDADAILSSKQIRSYDFQAGKDVVIDDWLGVGDKVKLALLAGASSPEIVVGQVMVSIAKLLDT